MKETKIGIGTIQVNLKGRKESAFEPVHLGITSSYLATEIPKCRFDEFLLIRHTEEKNTNTLDIPIISFVPSHGAEKPVVRKACCCVVKQELKLWGLL